MPIVINASSVSIMALFLRARISRSVTLLLLYARRAMRQLNRSMIVYPNATPRFLG
jgi:hypothetical protein